MKSYTDIEQSEVLSKIISLESADMCYIKYSSSDNPTWRFDDELPPMILGGIPIDEVTAETLPCWSLVALFGVLPILNNRSPVISKTFDRKYRVVYHSTAYEKAILTSDYNNPVDACYEMIIKLHELKML